MALVAAVPMIGFALLVLVQLALIGHSAWSAANAARAAARAAYVGADAERAARAALPPGLTERLELNEGGEALEVRLRPPRLLELPVPTVSASALLAPEGGLGP